MWLCKEHPRALRRGVVVMVGRPSGKGFVTVTCMGPELGLGV